MEELLDGEGRRIIIKGERHVRQGSDLEYIRGGVPVFKFDPFLPLGSESSSSRVRDGIPIYSKERDVYRLNAASFEPVSTARHLSILILHIDAYEFFRF